MTPMLAYADAYNPEDFVEACRQYSHLSPYLDLLKNIILDVAGRESTGGLSYGGEMVNGKPQGALHIYRQAIRFRQVPNPEFVADWYALRDHLNESATALLQQLLEKMRTDWYMSWLRKQPEYPEIALHLDKVEADLPGQGWLGTDETPILGEASIDIRLKPPDEHVKIISLMEATGEG